MYPQAQEKIITIRSLALLQNTSDELCDDAVDMRESAMRASECSHKGSGCVHVFKLRDEGGFSERFDEK